MTLNAGDYRINVPFIKALTENMTQKEQYDFIGHVAVITGVPIIIVCHYMMELYGHNVELDAFTKRLKYFYNIEEVKGV